VQHIAVSKANDAEAAAFQDLGSSLIPGDPLFVMGSIELHDQTRLETSEVDGVSVDWNLPPKLESTQLPPAHI
jgi:hypothetical protein